MENEKHDLGKLLEDNERLKTDNELLLNMVFLLLEKMRQGATLPSLPHQPIPYSIPYPTPTYPTYPIYPYTPYITICDGNTSQGSLSM